MPVPSPRNKILPARGNYSDLLANVAAIADGEICYAIDQDQYYQNEAGTLVAVGATKAQGTLADTSLQPTSSIDALADVDTTTTAPTVGQVLMWDNTSGNWEPGTVLTVVSSIDEIGDVDTATLPPTNGQFLGWNGTNWVPATSTTDLTYTAATRVLASSTGADATLPVVVASGDSGLMIGADKAKLDGIEAGATADQTGAEIKAAYEANGDTNAYTDAEKAKLAGIEAGATADQTAAEIKTAYESNANTNAYTDTDKTKLATIETGATADQTATEIKAAYESNVNTNAYTDAEKTKLAGVETNANNYILPAASDVVLGGIKVGTNLSMDGNGVLSADISSALSFQGVIDATAAPPVSPVDDGLYINDTAGTINAGFTGVTGTVAAGDWLIYDSVNDWSHVGVAAGVGVTSVTGAAPITIGGTAASPEVQIDPTYAVRLDDGGAKQTIQSGGLGISDGVTENITLNPSGSATFTGSVGIGTASPNAALTVNRTGVMARFQTGAATDGRVEFAYNTSDVGYINAAATDGFGVIARSGVNLQLGAGGSERLRIDNSGNVGIGTTSPGTTLDARGIVSIGSSNLSNAILQKSAVPGGSYNLTLTGGGGLTSESATTPTDALAGSVIKLVGGNPATDPYGGGIQYYANGSTTPNAAGNGNQHVFYTRSGVNTYKERVRIDHLGGVTINADGDATQLIIKRATANQDNGLQLQDQASNTKAFFNLEGTATNRLQIGGSNEIAFFTNSTFGNPPSNERLRIDSSGRLLVGTSSARSNFYNSPTNAVRFQVEGTNFEGASAALIRSSDNASSPAFVLAKSRGASVGSNTIVQNGDFCGEITFQGNDGSEFLNAAAIAGVIDGTPGANDMPGRLVFSTTADGAASPTERMRIDSSGRLLIGTSSSRSSRVYYPGGSSSFASTEQIEGIGATGSLQVVSNQAGTVGASLILGKSRGASVGSVTAVSNGDQLGTIQFNGVDVTTTGDLESCAGSIECEVDGTPGANDMPGRLVFSTTADGASNPTERMRIDSSGRLLVGTSASYGIGSSASAKIQTGDITGSIAASFTSWSSFNDGGIISLGKAKGGSIGSYTAVASGDTLGQIRFAGADGADLESLGASIEAVVDGAPGLNDMPGRLVFSTTADGAASPTERMRIKSDGIVNVGNTPVYADNAAAKTGGLVDGDIYRKSDGTLMIVYT